MERLKLLLGDVIKSNVAFRALAHVISRVNSLNKAKFPITVEAIGLSGSALTSKEIGDIDIVLCYAPRRRFAEEWEKFIRTLHEKFGELWSLIVESSYFTSRVTMDFVIENFYDEIVRLGFKKWWIEEWLKWTHVSDFRWGVDRGLPMVYFGLRELIERYIKHGWHGKRLEVHIEGIEKVLASKIPHVIVWRRRRGLVRPSMKELKEFFLKEQQELLNLSTNVVKGNWFELPRVYWDVNTALESKFEIPQYFVHGFVMQCFVEAKKIHDRAKKELKNKIKELGKRIKKPPKKKLSNIVKYNRELRNLLKEILAYTYIINTIKYHDTITKPLYRIRDKSMHTYLRELKKYLIRNGVRHGHRKYILEKALHNLIWEFTTTSS